MTKTHSINSENIDPRILNTAFITVCDVNNPFYGL